ncbi:hypothetical protein ACJZ2D_016408 [Fusarium nematophilum]
MLPLTPVFLWALFIFIVFFPPHYLSLIYFSFAAVIIFFMRSTIHLFMPIGWYLAWTWFLSSLRLVVPKKMPVGWYIFWAGALAALAALIHPASSLIQFLAWTAAMWVVRFTAFWFYVTYWLYPMKSELFPFNIFSGTWRVPKPRWFPESNEVLCDRCQKFTTNSRLIMGSRLPFVRLTEWYTHHGSIDSLRASAASEDSRSCNVCNILWHSISDKGTKTLQEENKKGAFKVKVWEERPLSLYTYVQLFKNGREVGARLLVHREKLFQKPSPSLSEAYTESPAHFQQAGQWLRECRRSHENCGNTKYPIPLPTRLLYIQGPSPGALTPRVKLVETANSNINDEYVALSYCWGLKHMAEQPFLLRRGNYLSCLEDINFSKLSRTMQHAIVITHQLGFSYLWIDSLCIIQQDPAPEESATPSPSVTPATSVDPALDSVLDSATDWKNESRKMARVYSNATCTIAATASTSGDGGCFRKRDLPSLRPYKIGRSPPRDAASEHIYIRCDDVFDFERYVDRAPINRRGWVFQERILSRRILHFGERIINWECRQRSASEVSPDGYVYKKYPDDFRDHYAPKVTGVETRDQLMEAEREVRGLTWAGDEGVRRRPPPPKDDPDDPPSEGVDWHSRHRFWKDIRKASTDDWNEDVGDGSGFRAAFDRLQRHNFPDLVGTSSFSYNWYELVETYTRGELSFSNDKLVAMSAISQEIARLRGYNYVAGLWRESLLTDMLWFVANGPAERLPMESEQRPSANMAQTSDSDDSLLFPTWTWASLEGTVSIDLLPENSLGMIGAKTTLATVQDVSINLPPGGDTSSAPQRGTVVLRGPLCSISSIKKRGTTWQISVGGMFPVSARFYPDIKLKDANNCSDLKCLSIIELKRSKVGRFRNRVIQQIQGLVLEAKSDSSGGDFVFERVGLFMTGTNGLSWQAKKIFKGQETTVIIR